jgi:hypothetical protein
MQAKGSFYEERAQTCKSHDRSARGSGKADLLATCLKGLWPKDATWRGFCGCAREECLISCPRRVYKTNTLPHLSAGQGMLIVAMLP